jgi:hypothetical protein
MDQYSNPIRAQRLEPGTDLAAAYEAGKTALTIEGFVLEPDVGLGFCFAVRGEDKVQLVMRVVGPGQLMAGHGGSIGLQAHRDARTKAPASAPPAID